MINMLYIINYVQVASNNSYGLMIPTPNNNDIVAILHADAPIAWNIIDNKVK